MGNFIVSLPSIKVLRDFYNEDNYYLVVDESYREIAGTIEGLDELILYPRRKLKESSWLKRVVSFIRFIRRLKALSPDIIIDLEGRQVASLITFLTGAPLRVGYSTAKKAYFYNKKVFLPGEEKHRVYRYMEAAAALGADCGEIFLDLKAPNAKRESLRNKLENLRIDLNKPLICIHPGAGRIFRQWSSKGFAEVADWLSVKDFTVVFTGAGSDLLKVNEVISLMRCESYNLAGRLSLGELAALFELSALYIGNDTGPLHLASSVRGLPVVGIFFRPGADRTWYPFTAKSIVVKGDTGCLKCKGKDCQLNMECIQKLSPEEVKSAVERILNNIKVYN